MKVKAAVAFSAGEPLVIEIVDLEGPKDGEVLVEIKATGVCHTHVMPVEQINEAFDLMHRGDSIRSVLTF